MKIYLETNTGKHWDFYGIEERGIAGRVNALAQQLATPPPRHAAPSARTIKAAETSGRELTGVLDEGALIALELSDPVVALARRARDLKFGQERIRGLIC